MPEEDAWRSMWHKCSARCAPAPSGPIRATSTPEDVGARPAPGARRRLHSSPVEPTDVEPAVRPERVVKIIDNASNNTFDLEERQLRRNFHRNARHQSASVFAAFGRLGLASLAMVICVTLVLGTVVVWWSTGVETQPVVGCLVGLFQADYSTQVGDKLEAMLTEAHNSLELTLAATLILSNSTDDPGALLATLFSPLSANRSNAAELVGHFSAIASAHANLRFHVARADGSYFGVWMDANSSSLHREVRAPDGCLERDGVVLACDWRPESQEWYRVSSSCGFSEQYFSVESNWRLERSQNNVESACLSDPFPVPNGAAVALQRQVKFNGTINGVVAVEVRLKPLETYMGQLMQSSSRLPQKTMRVALLDENGALLATSGGEPSSSLRYASKLSAAPWDAVSETLQHARAGGTPKACGDFMSHPMNFHVDCHGFNVEAVARCHQVGPVNVADSCVLLADCSLGSAINSTGEDFPVVSTDVRGVISRGNRPRWHLQQMVAQEDFYPGFDNAIFTTFGLSISLSLGVAFAIAWLVSRYGSAVRGGDEMSPRGFLWILMFLILLNYCLVFLIWYFLFRDAWRTWRDSTLNVLHYGLVSRTADLLETLPRAAMLFSQWEQIWRERSTRAEWPRDLLAQLLMDSVHAPGVRSNASVLLPAAPPADRLVLSSLLASVMYINGSGSIAQGAQRWPDANQPFSRSGDCTERCPEDPTSTAWWSSAAALGWSEVHLLNDQLALSYVLPLPNFERGGARDRPLATEWVVCTMPLAALQRLFEQRHADDYLTGIILQNSGSQKGSLVASFLGDEEDRREVGSSWFTLRRRATESEPLIRITVEAAEYAMETETKKMIRDPRAIPLHLNVPSYNSELSINSGEGFSSPVLLSEQHIQQIYRTEGAPRTQLTPLRGGDCSQDALNGQAVGCGLDWILISLINYKLFLQQQEKTRSLSVCVFTTFLLVQLYFIQTLIHTMFRRIEASVRTSAHSTEDPMHPTHSLAIAELAERDVSSVRRSKSRSVSSVCSARDRNASGISEIDTPRPGRYWFDRCRGLISQEVLGAHLVHRQRGAVELWAQFLLLKVVKVLHSVRILRLHALAARLDQGLFQEKVETADERKFRHAYFFIRLSKQHCNILTVCGLRRKRRFLALLLYWWQSSSTYQTFLQIVVVFHCLLQAREPSARMLEEGRRTDNCPVYVGGDWGGYRDVMILELICLIFESTDVIISLWVLLADVCGERAPQALQHRSSGYFIMHGLFRGENMLQPSSAAVRRVARALLIFVLIGNWLSLSYYCFTLEHYVPLRPAWLLLCSSVVHTVTSAIWKSLFTVGMQSAGVCFSVFWLLSSIGAALIMRTRGNGIQMQACNKSSISPEEIRNSEATLRQFMYTATSYQSVLPSMLSVFVLISTGETLMEVLNRFFVRSVFDFSSTFTCAQGPLCGSLCFQCMDETNGRIYDTDIGPRSSAAIFYFIAICFIGSVLMVGLFIGLLQTSFNDYRADARSETKLYERVGALAAFSLLATDSAHTHHDEPVVSFDLFHSFVEYLEQNYAMRFQVSRHELFQLLKEEKESEDTGEMPSLEVEDFVFNLWRLLLKGTIYHTVETDNPFSWQLTLRRAFAHPTQVVQKAVKISLLLHAVAATMYALNDDWLDASLDLMLSILCVFEGFEVALKLAAYGFQRFWWGAEYDPAGQGLFTQWENRTAAVVMGSTLAVFVTTYLLDDEWGNDARRLGLVLPTVRLFFVLHTARRVVFAMVPLRTYIGSALFLVLIIMWVYAIVGVTMFEGELASVADPAHRVRLTCFDSIPSAMLTLAQILNGEAWNEVMYAVINAHHSIYWLSYFVSFVIIETLMLTNLLVGVVLDSTTWFSMNTEDVTLQEHVGHGQKISELDELEGTYMNIVRERDGQKSSDSLHGSGLEGERERAHTLSSHRNRATGSHSTPKERSNTVTHRPCMKPRLSVDDSPMSKPSLLPQLTLKTLRADHQHQRRKQSRNKSRWTDMLTISRRETIGGETTPCRVNPRATPKTPETREHAMSSPVATADALISHKL